MIARRQLPVVSPIAPAALWRAAFALAREDHSLRSAIRSTLLKRTGAAAVTLTDSGTSALVLALRLAVGRGGTVAYPGYSCVDLAAAARFAGVRVRLYDLDPATLAPDFDSLTATLRRGVDAVVVAHLYGYPVDVHAVHLLAAPFGATVVEDAAQGAGARIDGKPAGGLGHLAILSFGRGKGLCAGRGGALLASAEWAERARAVQPGQPGAGTRELLIAAALWLFGRPSMYRLPSLLPWLQLGEMVYHAAHEPAALTRSASVLLQAALSLEEAELGRRRRIAAALLAASAGVPGLAPARPVKGAEPGYLRFAARDLAGCRRPVPQLGILRGYPRTLHEQPELRGVLHDGEPATPGATELRRSLFTLPTHGYVAPRDLVALRAWLSSSGVTVLRRSGPTPSRGPELMPQGNGWCAVAPAAAAPRDGAGADPSG